MLVLTRKPSQSIMIGDDVEISVLSVTGEKVRLGITAPREVPIFRTEIYTSIDREGDEPTESNGHEPVDVALQKLAEPG
jgi:carbon storage regulator